MEFIIWIGYNRPRQYPWIKDIRGYLVAGKIRNITVPPELRCHPYHWYVRGSEIGFLLFIVEKNSSGDIAALPRKCGNEQGEKIRLCCDAVLQVRATQLQSICGRKKRKCNDEANATDQTHDENERYPDSFLHRRAVYNQSGPLEVFPEESLRVKNSSSYTAIIGSSGSSGLWSK